MNDPVYRSEPVEVEDLRAQVKHLEANQRRTKAALYWLLTAILWGGPLVLLIRYHAPSKILVPDVLALALWVGFLIKELRQHK